MSVHPLTRRTVLAVSASAAGAALLAACSGSTHKAAAGTGGPGASTDNTARESAADSAPASGVSSAAGGAVTLAKLDAIPVGQAVSGTLPDGKPCLIARPTASTAACFSAICTHMGCTVAPAGKQLHCPCHGSVYDATTGAVIHGPAPRALPPIAVQVDGGNVVTAG